MVDAGNRVLKSLEEFLTMCDAVKAHSSDKAKEFLETQDFGMAILSIMGVDGCKFLGIANEK